MFLTDIILNGPWCLKRESFEEESVLTKKSLEKEKGKKDSGVRRKEHYYNEEKADQRTPEKGRRQGE